MVEKVKIIVNSYLDFFYKKTYNLYKKGRIAD